MCEVLQQAEHSKGNKLLLKEVKDQIKQYCDNELQNTAGISYLLVKYVRSKDKLLADRLCDQYFENKDIEEFFSQIKDQAKQNMNQLLGLGNKETILTGILSNDMFLKQVNNVEFQWLLINLREILPDIFERCNESKRLPIELICMTNNFEKLSICLKLNFNFE